LSLGLVLVTCHYCQNANTIWSDPVPFKDAVKITLDAILALFLIVFIDWRIVMGVVTPSESIGMR